MLDYGTNLFFALDPDMDYNGYVVAAARMAASSLALLPIKIERFIVQCCIV